MISPRFYIILASFAFATSLNAMSSTGEHPGSLAILLGLDSVRKELNLTPNQSARLDKIRTDFKSTSRQVVAAATSDAVSQKTAGKTLRALIDKNNARAMSTLTVSQRSRLIQIEHHLLGGTMLLSPPVQKQLALTNAQILAIDKIHKKGLADVARINKRFANGDISCHERLAALRAHRINQASAMLKLLTPSQREALRALRGQPFQSA